MSCRFGHNFLFLSCLTTQRLVAIFSFSAHLLQSSCKTFTRQKDGTNVMYVSYMFHYDSVRVPGADHILAQPLKRCNASRIKPNETFELAKKRQNILCVGGGGRERISLRCCQVTHKVPKTVKYLFVLQFCSWDGSFRHGEMKIWLCLYFQHVTRYIGTDFVEESRQKMQRSEEEHFLVKGALIGKSMFQTQPINAVHGRCSSSGVLRDIPSNFTRSVRRRIVL